MAFGSGCAHILVDHTVLQVHIVHRQADHGAVLTQAQLGTQGQQGQGWKPEGQTTLRLALRPGSETATLSRLWWGHTNKHMVASPACWSTNPPTLPSAEPSATFPVETDPTCPLWFHRQQGTAIWIPTVSTEGRRHSLSQVDSKLPGPCKKPSERLRGER